MRLQAKLRETAAGGVVIQGEHVLLLRRPSGEWVMPKGKLELGEAEVTAALREVEEESGINATVVRPLGTTHYRYLTPAGNLVHKSVHWFLMKYEGGDLNLEPSFSEGRFVPVEEAVHMLTFDNDREVLKKARAKIAAGQWAVLREYNA